MPTKCVTYKGVVYRRYGDRRYYVPSAKYIREGYTSLHRQKWIDYWGAIPDWYHIHHKDGDPDNNRLSNLECVPAGAHALLHYVDRGDLKQAQRKWAKSKQGQKTLKANMRTTRNSLPKRRLSCRYCHGAFVTRHPNQKYCSPECRERDNYPLEKRCEICGGLFRAKAHKTKEVRTCSRRCGWALRRKNAGL